MILKGKVDKKIEFFFVFFLFFLISSISIVAAVQDSKLKTAEEITKRFAAISRPDPEGIATKVYVGIIVLDVTRVNDIDQTFHMDFILSISWKDPRVVQEKKDSVTGRTYSMDEIWHPYATIFNERDLKSKLRNIFRVDGSGNVQYMQRFIGELSCPLDLRGFPLDRQTLPVNLISIRYGPEEVEFIADKKRTTLRKVLSVAGWAISLIEPMITTEYFDVQDRHLVRFDFRLKASRLSSFYFLKMLIPLALIIFMAWTVFWIDPSLISVQIGVSTASVFSLILFQYRLGQLLPPVPYLTRIDQFVQGATIIIFLALAETIFTSRLAKKGKERLGRKIDVWGRWTYLILIALVLIYSFFL